MAWSDRRYDDDYGSRWGGGSNPVLILIGIVVGAALLRALLVGTQVVGPLEFLNWFGVSRDTLSRGWIWQFLTYQFVHGGVWHLFINCLMLYFGSRILMVFMSPAKIVTLCLICGAIGGLGVFLPSAGDLPTVGISGGVMGLWVIAAVLAPNMEVNVFFVFVTRLKWVVLGFVLIDIFTFLGGGMRPFGDGGGIAVYTHMLGELSGFVIAYVVPRYITPRYQAARYEAERRRKEAIRAKDAADEGELDRILDKINREGMPSLSDAERAFLKKSASRYQDSRKP